MKGRFVQNWLPLALCLVSALGMSGCSSIDSLLKGKEPNVVYALGTRDAFTSPLLGSLKPACPALDFGHSGYQLLPGHKRALETLVPGAVKGQSRYLIVGYAPPSLTEDYARSLTERRAQAVRQYLIEQGIEPARLQTVGFGKDLASSSPSAGVVVIYVQP